MGIYDREYYRGETRGAGWLTGLAPACKTIIIINVVVFFLEPTLKREGVFQSLEASSRAIFEHANVWQLLTATFLHEGLGHLFWNMLFLWMVGREMEAFYGTREFVALYLTAAVVSTLGWAAIDYSLIHSNPLVNTHMLGASGAIMAVVVLYALYNPHREVLVFFVLPMEMWLIVLLYLAFDAYQLLGMMSSPDPFAVSFGNAAVASHLTGAAFGFLYKKYDLRWSRLSWDRFRRPRLRVIMPEPREKPSARPSGPTWSPNPPTTPKPSSTAVLPEELLDAKLDEILAKIARDGRSGLTEEENRILQEASRRAKNRRSDRI